MTYCDCDCEGCVQNHSGNKKAGRGLEELIEFDSEKLIATLKSFRQALEKKLKFGRENFMQEWKTSQERWQREIDLIDELLQEMEEDDIF